MERREGKKIEQEPVQSAGLRNDCPVTVTYSPLHHKIIPDRGRWSPKKLRGDAALGKTALLFHPDSVGKG